MRCAAGTNDRDTKRTSLGSQGTLAAGGGQHTEAQQQQLQAGGYKLHILLINCNTAMRRDGVAAVVVVVIAI